jgi:hypothetical protein
MGPLACQNEPHIGLEGGRGLSFLPIWGAGRGACITALGGGFFVRGRGALGSIKGPPVPHGLRYPKEQGWSGDF